MQANKNNLQRFAIFGGKPLFSEPLSLCKPTLPPWEKYVATMQAIFERQYYTNQGPLVRKLENELSHYFGTKHVICVTNKAIALLVAAKGIGVEGKIIVPAFAAAETQQSLLWAGFTPIFCDVDLHTHHLTSATLAKVKKLKANAILAVNLWGGSCDAANILRYAQQHQLSIYFDSTQSFSCQNDKAKLGSRGALEVFSLGPFFPSPIDGACITTNDDFLATRLRNIRSSYGVDKVVTVQVTGNGRMSEAQAAMILMGLENLQTQIDHNQRIFNYYFEHIHKIPGFSVVMPTHIEKSNYQYVIVKVSKTEIGLSSKELLMLLQAENIAAAPAITSPFLLENDVGSLADLSNTKELLETVIQLPAGPAIQPKDIVLIAQFFSDVSRYAKKIQKKLSAV